MNYQKIEKVISNIGHTSFKTSGRFAVTCYGRPPFTRLLFDLEAMEIVRIFEEEGLVDIFGNSIWVHFLDDKVVHYLADDALYKKEVNFHGKSGTVSPDYGFIGYAIKDGIKFCTRYDLQGNAKWQIETTLHVLNQGNGFLYAHFP